MSRTAKLWGFGVVFVVAVLWVLVIGAQAVVANGTVRGAPGAVNGEGWMQIAIALAAALKTGEGWVAALRSAAQTAATNLGGPNGERIAVSIDIASLGYYKWQLGNIKDPAQKLKITEAARMEADSLRDREFPLPPGAPGA